MMRARCQSRTATSMQMVPSTSTTSRFCTPITGPRRIFPLHVFRFCTIRLTRQRRRLTFISTADCLGRSIISASKVRRHTLTSRQESTCKSPSPVRMPKTIRIRSSPRPSSSKRQRVTSLQLLVIRRCPRATRPSGLLSPTLARKRQRHRVMLNSSYFTDRRTLRRLM